MKTKSSVIFFMPLMKLFCLFTGTIMLMVCCLAPDALSQQSTTSMSAIPKRILVLYSYPRSAQAQEEFRAGFERTLANAPVPYLRFYEYLDIVPPRSSNQKAILRDLIVSKYSGQRFDLIVTVFDPALNFLLNEGRDISPGTPAVSLFGRNVNVPEGTGRPLAQIPHRIDHQGTLEVALLLFPETERVLFISGVDAVGQANEKEAMEAYISSVKKLQFEYTSHLTVEETLKRVAQLPSKSIVIYSSLGNDRTGRVFAPREIAERIVKFANAPVLGIISTYLGTGTLGGSMVDCQATGEMLARIALTMDKHTTLPDIGSARTVIKPMFDWAQIKRWKASTRHLPANSVFINRPPTLWESNKAVVIMTLLVASLMSALIVALTVQNRRRKTAENKAHTSAHRLRTIFDGAPIGMYQTTLDGRFLQMNQAQATMFGYASSEEMMRLVNPVGTITLWVSAVARSELVEKVKSAHGGYVQQQVTMYKKDGSLLEVIFYAMLSTSPDTHEPCLVGFVQDMTEHNRLEEQLRQSQKMESVGRIAGGVAHDFNNMLSVILSAAQLSLLKVTEDCDLGKNLKAIESAAERSSAITRQLLAFSRKEAITPKPVNLNVQIFDMQKNLGRLIGEDIKFTFSPVTNIWTVKIDPSQLDQILMNLSVNARDAMSSCGSLTIETANINIDSEYSHSHLGMNQGDYVQLTVSDSGCGMDEETCKHIFEPFFTTKELGKGTGLGLATVYGIVTQNNGFIDVNSKPGQGTVFKIFLPRVMENVIEQKQDFTKPLKGSGTILLVEDEELLLYTTTKLLNEIGYSVIQAVTPELALSICKNNDRKIDLVLTDVVMPGMNGREMVDRIKMMQPDMKVLFMSGYTADIVLQRGIVDEDIYFIHKPLEIKLLNDKICHILQGASALTSMTETGSHIESALPVSFTDDNEVIELFIAKAPEYLIQIQAGLRDGDIEKIRFYAHKLKGAAVTIGCSTIAGIAYELDELSGSCEIDIVDSNVKRLNAELERLLSALNARQ